MTTSTTTTPSTRPSLVTAIVALVILNGLLSIVTGIMAMVAHGSLFVGGLLMIVVGAAYLAVARGLFAGNNTARLVVAVVSVAQLVLGVLNNGNDAGGSRTSGIGSAVLALIILVILYTPRANAFFGAHHC